MKEEKKTGKKERTDVTSGEIKLGIDDELVICSGEEPKETGCFKGHECHINQFPYGYNLRNLLEQSQKANDEAYKRLQECFVAEYTKTIVNRSKWYMGPILQRPRWKGVKNTNRITVIYRFYENGSDAMCTREISMYGYDETFIYSPSSTEERIGLIRIVKNKTIAGSFDGWDLHFIKTDFLKCLRMWEGCLETGDTVSPLEFKQFLSRHDHELDTITVKLLPDKATGEVKEFEFQYVGDNYKQIVTVK